MKIIHGDSFTNLGRLRYKAIGTPAFRIKDFKVVKNDKKLDYLEDKLQTDIIKQRSDYITPENYKNMLIGDIISENGPYFRYDAILVITKHDKDRNPGFMVKGHKTGLDYMMITPLEKIKD